MYNKVSLKPALVGRVCPVGKKPTVYIPIRMKSLTAVLTSIHMDRKGKEANTAARTFHCHFPK